MKLDATAYFQCAKDDIKIAKQHTRTWYFAENYMFLRRKWDPSVRYVNYVTDLLAQCSLYNNTIYYFQYQRRMLFLIFIIYCFNAIIFFLVNSSNLMDTIKTIIVLIELQLNSTVNS